MDMVLVHQTSREGFDRMPWMPDGKVLWAFIKAKAPILLTQVREARFGLTSQEKLAWIDRELGLVPVIFTPDSRGKAPFARAGDVLIDDSRAHGEGWLAKGGVFVHHVSAAKSIEQLRGLL